MQAQPVASVRHLLIFLGIFMVLFLAGSRAPRPSPNANRLKIYASVIVAQGLLLYFVRRGVAARGHTLAELAGPRPSAAGVAFEILLGIIAAVLIRFLLQLLRQHLGVMPDRTSALLPRGALESVVWIAVSCIAGIGEEIAFRGYLQRQFTAYLRSPIVATVGQCAVFGLAHGYQGLKPIVTTAAFGLCATLLCMWRRSTYAAIVAHIATDIAGGLRF